MCNMGGPRWQIRLSGVVIAGQTEVTVGAKTQSPIIKSRDKGQVNEELGPPRKEL